MTLACALFLVSFWAGLQELILSSNPKHRFSPMHQQTPGQSIEIGQVHVRLTILKRRLTTRLIRSRFLSCLQKYSRHRFQPWIQKQHLMQMRVNQTLIRRVKCTMCRSWWILHRMGRSTSLLEYSAAGLRHVVWYSKSHLSQMSVSSGLESNPHI